MFTSLGKLVSPGLTLTKPSKSTWWEKSEKQCQSNDMDTIIVYAFVTDKAGRRTGLKRTLSGIWTKNISRRLVASIITNNKITGNRQLRRHGD